MVSYPTQEPPAEGAPPQSYGVPAQQPYGDPTQPYGGAPGQTPYTVPPVQGTNGLATAGLILGILPTGIIGLIVSILGLVRAPKVGGVGKTRAWIGLVLSVLWIIGGVAIFATAGTTAVKHSVTCNQVETKVQALGDKAQTDASDPTAYKADIQAIIDELNSGASKVSDSKSASDMRKTAADFAELLKDTDAGTEPPSDLITRLTTDGSAVDTDCSS